VGLMKLFALAAVLYSKASKNFSLYFIHLRQIWIKLGTSDVHRNLFVMISSVRGPTLIRGINEFRSALTLLH